MPEWVIKLFSDLKITDVVIALFSVGLTIYTARLWRSTEKLWTSSREQTRITRELFITEQRPWLQVRLEAVALPTFNEAGSLKIPLRVTIKNIGRSPALRIGDGTGAFLHIGFDDTNEYFDRMRHLAEERSGADDSVTMFPDEESSLNLDVWATPSEIEDSEKKRIKSAFHCLAVTYKYKSSLSDQVLETSRLYGIWLGQEAWPLPREPRNMYPEIPWDRVVLRIVKESIV